MNQIQPITPSNPACYGVCCQIHGTCARYAAVDGNSDPAQVFTDNCGPEHALYIPVWSVVQASAEQVEAA